MDREELLNDLTDTLADEVQAASVNAPAEPTGAEPAAAPADRLDGKEAAALLDAISEPDPNAAPRGPDGKFLPKEGADQAEAKQPGDAAKPNADAATEAKAGAEQKTPEQEADELIKEAGIKSERGQERIRSMFAKSKEAEAKAAQYEADISEFREMVTSTGMAPQEFAQMLEVGRLIKSGDEPNLRAALQIIDGQRAAIAKQLGVAVPGVDPLEDFPDLKAKVENMEITPETAAELAKYKRAERMQQESRQAQARQQQDAQVFQQSIAQAAQTAEAYFDTRKHEADYPAKMARIHAHFKDPAKMQEFVATYQPNQWFAQFKFMYDHMSVPPAPAHDPQPLRSKSTAAGVPAANPHADPITRDLQILDGLGI